MSTGHRSAFFGWSPNVVLGGDAGPIMNTTGQIGDPFDWNGELESQHEKVSIFTIRCGIKICIHSQTSTVAPLGFRNIYVISPTLCGACDYLIHVSKRASSVGCISEVFLKLTVCTMQCHLKTEGKRYRNMFYEVCTTTCVSICIKMHFHDAIFVSMLKCLVSPCLITINFQFFYLVWVILIYIISLSRNV